MSDLLRRIPTDSKEPVNLVCYHPVQIKNLLAGENVEPVCFAVDYEYESFLHEICVALGQQGGTRQQVIDAIKKLKTLPTCCECGYEIYGGGYCRSCYEKGKR